MLHVVHTNTFIFYEYDIGQSKVMAEFDIKQIMIFQTVHTSTIIHYRYDMTVAKEFGCM